MVSRKLFYSILLLALIAFKVSSTTIHIALHHDDDHDEPCELCEQAVNILNAQFATNAEIKVVQEQQKLDYHKQIDHYTTSFTTAFFTDTFLVRPPPTY